ncbi:proteasome endopeptidase complex beta subunit [Mycena floridula]|nr:proteasome endopeptidase complex beta subunit [Mycena floridula]KAJ7575276.1 proteasome endopeptidase complex beta subunit [Mycena floridula]
MDHFPLNWGKPLTDTQDHYSTFPIAQRTAAAKGPSEHTQQPIVTGSSVLALKYKDGIMMAADTLASYGSLARFKDVERLYRVEGSNTVIAASGDMSDFQYIKRVLQELMHEEFDAEDGEGLGAREIHEWLSQVMYARRSKMDPLWNSLLVGGVDLATDGKPKRFLAYVDLLGTTYSASTLATGYGSYIAQPLLRKYVEGNEDTLTEAQAMQIMEECMKVLFYRDARSLNKYQIAKITASGTEILPPRSAPTNWGFAEGIRGYGAQTQ